MTKKDKVRAFLKRAPEGETFTHNSLGEKLGVTAKDVSNVVRESIKGGGLELCRQPDKHGHKQFKVHANALRAFYAKYPTGYAPSPAKKVVLKTKKHCRRSPLMIAIDNEIAEHQRKIRELEQFKRAHGG